MRRSSDNQSVMNRMMLRFRPIAPKPVGGEAISGTAEQDKGIGGWRRAKRKYVRVRGRQSKKCAKTKITQISPPENSGIEDESSQEKGAVTLQLLPERSETEDDSYNNNSAQTNQENLNSTDRYNVDDIEVAANSGGGTVDFGSVRSVIETLIIVECVTDRFTAVGLGFSDKDKIYSLEQDTCPGFISDSKNNVIWVNEAYKKMVAVDAQIGAEKGFLVWLVVKQELPHFYPSFACRVRVIQQRGQGQKWNKIVPCDVWRMEFAGFAWKLDVNTALSLGL
ncbi:hypothetical protein DH2020_012781 [Rehmannia glutinosa]|uniref:DUF7950 domain-containing protein n=1 Tax=Rehmannia glutinosa TaxID=99300 RepID=A0ABR0X0D4_REHGL